MSCLAVYPPLSRVQPSWAPAVPVAPAAPYKPFIPGGKTARSLRDCKTLFYVLINPIPTGIVLVMLRVGSLRFVLIFLECIRAKLYGLSANYTDFPPYWRRYTDVLGNLSFFSQISLFFSKHQLQMNFTSQSLTLINKWMNKLINK